MRTTNLQSLKSYFVTQKHAFIVEQIIVKFVLFQTGLT